MPATFGGMEIVYKLFLEPLPKKPVPQAAIDGKGKSIESCRSKAQDEKPRIRVQLGLLGIFWKSLVFILQAYVTTLIWKDSRQFSLLSRPCHCTHKCSYVCPISVFFMHNV